MERRIGTISRGLRAPIIKEGDDLKKIVVDTLMSCVDNGDFEIGKKDVLAVTESHSGSLAGQLCHYRAAGGRTLKTSWAARL